jgi:hypothetical protein
MKESWRIDCSSFQQNKHYIWALCLLSRLKCRSDIYSDVTYLICTCAQPWPHVVCTVNVSNCACSHVIRALSTELIEIYSPSSSLGDHAVAIVFVGLFWCS